MIKLHYKKVRFAALLLLLVPSIIFMLTWVKLIIGIPCVALLGVALFFASKAEDRVIEVKATTLIAVGVIILIWAILSGQGGFFTQKSDYEIRNVIFRDLINYKWPVVYGGENDESLVYYIGYWFLPALIGKLAMSFGGFAAGWLVARIAIVLWTVVLIYTTLLLLLFKVGKGRRKAVYITLAIMILFSGMDALGAIYLPQKFLSHIEWWAGSFQYSSMSTQLCWVFNQAVPAWLACVLAYSEKDEKSFALIGLALLPTSPLPLIGLAVYMLAFAVRSLIIAAKGKQIAAFFKNIITVQNVIAVVTLVPVFGLYYMNNAVSTDQTSGGTPGIEFALSDVYTAVFYVLFVLLEFGFLLLNLKNKNNRFESIFIAVSLVIIPFIKVGVSIDFCMRASIPALFLLMMMLVEYLVPELCRKKNPNEDKNSKEYQKHAKKLLTVMLIFIIGCGTPLVEYTSSARLFIKTKGECVTKYDHYSSLTDLQLDGKMNFVGTDSENSAFYKYIAKK
ncbi:MAG: hypothetical protein IJI47_04125 [Eubacterium sp.]|nr:hypothetical protein [Eubacterium sp.]MBR0412734.1 hypothetical protein [Eubacterium sp.]